jgi:hypothetical protein
MFGGLASIWVAMNEGNNSIGEEKQGGKKRR